jgi:hypothetical protein
VTDKREKISTDPGLGPLEHPERPERPGPSTLRSIEAAEDLSSVSPNAPVYHEPAPLIAVSDHKTLEVETVKLAENIDPRKLATELRLGRVPSLLLVPESDSAWPPETALTSSQPPDGLPRRRWRAPLVLCALLGALLVLVLARAAARRSDTALGASVAKPAAAVGARPQVASAVAPVLAAAVPAVPVDDIPTETVAAPTHRGHAHTGELNAPQRSAKPNSQPAARDPLAAPSSSKPKRAIY